MDVSAQKHTLGDSIVRAVEPGYDSVSKTHRRFFGESYRKLWATPVKMKVFSFKDYGGLKIDEEGGGRQTKSLHLVDASGQKWTLRTIQKYPDSVLPEALRGTLAASIVQDQVTAEHPFGALVVPTLAQALGIPHANPQVVYVSDDPALGKYRKEFANKVFLFEEREPSDVDKTDNNDKTQKKLEADNDNHVDAKLILRARLLDFILGDWDRHGDQWRFEQIEDGKGTYFKPIPKDRDQVFYNGTGIFPTILSLNDSFEKFQNYNTRIRAIDFWNLNNQDFDRYYLSRLGKQDWLEQIADAQKLLTDQVISEAVKRMPPAIYRLSGPPITNKMIARRNGLKDQALTYYKFISHSVEVLGTAKKEYVDVTNNADGSVHVKINKISKEGKIEQVTFERTFDPADTKDVRIFALDGDDVFSMHGVDRSPIKVRMIGGDGEDTFNVDSSIKSHGNRYIYDRSDQKNIFPNAGQVKLRTGTDTLVNYYKRKYFKYSYWQPLLLASYNRDYGFQLIPEVIVVKQGFRKEPFASRQTFIANYGFGNNSLYLGYKGEFTKAIGGSDLVVNAFSKGPNYKYSFFGTGNESVFLNNEDQGTDVYYYRNTYDYVETNIGLRQRPGNWAFTESLTGQYYNGEGGKNQSKFIKNYADQHPDERVFDTKWYAGVTVNANYDTRDKSLVPHRGVNWNTTISGITGIKQNEHSYGQIKTEFSFFITPPSDSTFVIANRIGGGTTIGNAEYFQQLTLGGNVNLRGYYFQRFTGKSYAYDNLEVRFKLFDFNSYVLPGTVGAVGFNDIGRVWSPGENSNVWHDGFGGGLYFTPAQLILIEGLVGFSKEGAYPYFTVGFRF
ncbi:BamA/TamA family outer membrane protein [Mucilaginibacter ginkgonis]|nr:BamA/TamA family outer membrane protein [Mucilaginibacter ginkgonis]